MLWGESRGKWKGRQLLGVEPRTPLAWAASALPLSHDSWTINNPHNTLYVLHRWYWMPSLTHLVAIQHAVHIEDCEGWWLPGCCGSVAEHCRLKPEVFWVWLLAAVRLFTFLCFRHIASKFIFLFQVNFARMYLPRLLRELHGKVIYIDTDCIVQGTAIVACCCCCCHSWQIAPIIVVRVERTLTNWIMLEVSVQLTL